MYIGSWPTAKKGEFAFSKSCGNPRKEHKLRKDNKVKNLKSGWSETEQELAKLQNENLNLRIENEYLKGLRGLRIERQVRENPDLFKTSTDNTSSRSNNS